MGTRFIASTECGAEQRYKELVVSSTHDDIIYTDKVSGIHANFFASTVPKDHHPGLGPEAAQRWKDIWSAGQGVTLIDTVKPVGEIVEGIVREYHDAVASLCQ
jgi:nitronate monooxygenase